MENELLWAEYPQYDGADTFEHLDFDALNELPPESMLETLSKRPLPRPKMTANATRMENQHDLGG